MGRFIFIAIVNSFFLFEANLSLTRKNPTTRQRAAHISAPGYDDPTNDWHQYHLIIVEAVANCETKSIRDDVVILLSQQGIELIYPNDEYHSR